MRREAYLAAHPPLRYPIIRDVAGRAGRLRGKDVVNQVEFLIPPASRILDLGCGVGFVAEELMNRGHRVVGVDPVDVRLTMGFEFVEASAYNLPFKDDSFDVCLLHTALHHMEFPDEALREAHRVARRTIVGEELRLPSLNWWILRQYDKLINLSFRNNPHSNRSHMDWLKTFDRLGFIVEQKIESKVFGFIHQVIYSLSRNN